MMRTAARWKSEKVVEMNYNPMCVCVCVYRITPGRMTILSVFLSSALNIFPTFLSNPRIMRCITPSCAQHTTVHITHNALLHPDTV